jgi:hypothetical protein
MGVKSKILAFIRASDRNRAMAGMMLFLLTLIPVTLLLLILEHSFWFEAGVRTVLFYFFLITAISSFIILVFLPLLRYWGLWNKKNEKEAAFEISQTLPELRDELINYLELEENKDNALAQASLYQKEKHLGGIDFFKAIDTHKIKKLTRYAIAVLVVFFSVAFINPPLISESGQRLWKHRTSFEEPAPFRFEILSDSLEIYRNERFSMKVGTVGKLRPGEMYVLIGNNKFPMRSENSYFSYTFNGVQSDIAFQLEASGFRSATYTIRVIDRPSLNVLNLFLEFPEYTGLKNDSLQNPGDLSVPEGTSIQWTVETDHASSCQFFFKDDTLEARRLRQNQFEAVKILNASSDYEIRLENTYSLNDTELLYRVSVIEDEYPVIQAEYLTDSTLYDQVWISGSINDDYGFHSLELRYQINNEEFRQPITIDKNAKQQDFMVSWSAKDLKLTPKDRVELFVVVRDNDDIHGYKKSQSSLFSFQRSDLSTISDLINQRSSRTEDQIQESLKESEAINEALEELSDRLKSKNDINWQEEKLANNLLKQRQELEEMLKELNEKHDDLMRSQRAFEQSESLREKSEQFKESLDDLLDDETRQLYEELQKLLQDASRSSEVQQKLEEISRNEQRLQKDLERTRELFKRLKLEASLERTRQQLDSLASEQEQLAEQEELNPSEQEELIDDLEKIQQDLQEAENLNQELKKPQALQNFDSDMKDVEQEMNKAMDQMENQDREGARKNQEKAGEKLRQISEKMQNMQAGMEMEVMQENIDHLRKILDDLIKLSYEQERILDAFRDVDNIDPRFITLSQEQLKLKGDLTVIEDSLMALAERVVPLSAFITKEVDEINYQMDEAVEQIRERQRGRALSHQQFSMTAMNNLALLLNDVLENMQMTMSESMGNSKGGKPQQSSIPSLGEMQQQLGEEIKKLPGKGNQGKQLSKELAELAAEQELIRRELQRLQDKLKGQPASKGADDLQKAIEMMEQNEIDLVNKRITQQLIDRQEKIKTRMLEAEKAQREQDMDPERESETGRNTGRALPPDIQDYLNERKKEIERLRNVPIELNPFYKNEVNDYFRRLSEQRP